jgi:hypothetical protein
MYREQRMLKWQDQNVHAEEMTISESASRKNRYIPFRKSDIVEMCSREAPLSESDVKEFRDLCQILEALFHFEFHKRLETLKNCYAPFNPDTDTRAVFSYSEIYKKNLYFVPGSTIIKLFQNVPKADLEMLFPNSKVRMKTIDKLIIGVPAAVSGTIVVATKLGASLILVASVLAFWMGLKENEPRIQQQHLIALGAGLGALGGFLFRQINKFKNRKIRFMKALSENLYFKNLDNNAGVFYHLIDAAEEEEFKEAVLAYYFLLTTKQDLTKHQLDDRIEKWFEDKWNCSIDFEIDDAMKKLEQLELISRDGDTLRCKPLLEAKRRLDDIWDNYFTVP